MNAEGFNTMVRRLSLILLVFMLLPVRAQYREAVLPVAGHKPYRGQVHKIDLPDALPRPQKPDDPHTPVPMPAGYVSGFSLVVGGDNLWQLDPVGRIRYWRATIDFGKPVNTALYFDRFDPGERGKLYVAADQGDWQGAFTRNSVAVGQPFALAPIFAKQLTLHFEVPDEDKDFYISLSEIGVLYKADDQKGFGTSGPCEVNVNCSEGAAWQKQKRGVVRVLVRQGSFLFYCSGSLINNTANNNVPYLLTANHCGENATSADYAQWVFSFNYESASCANPLVEPSYQTLVGSTLIAHSTGGTQNGSDFKLLRLLQNVPLVYQPYFNGWSRRNQISSSGTGIHHPDGDIKKISTYTTQPVSSGYGTGGNNPAEKYWRLQWSATANGFGVTEGGSSGSPLLNSDGLIAGMLTGGSSSCSNTSGYDFYGKFSYSWESNGTASFNQLRPWLDPLNTGQEELQGLDSDPLYLEAGFSANRNEITINQFVEFENTSGGLIDTFEWRFPGGDPPSSNKKKPEPVLYRQYGNYDVQLIVGNTARSDTLTREAYIRVKPFVYPNPAPGDFSIGFGVELTDDLDVSFYDLFGREVRALIINEGSKLRVTMPQTARGLYLIKISDRYVEKQLKVLIVR